MSGQNKQTFIVFLSLFTSVGTLICCALPAFLVSLGMGAVMAGLVSNFPALVWVSQYKIIVFVVAAILLIASYVILFVAPQSCPSDLKQAKVCAISKRISVIVFWSSVVLYVIGFIFAFLVKYFI